MKAATADNSHKKKPEEVDTMPRFSVREQLRSLKPFWVAPDQKKKALWMLAGVVGLTVVEIALTAGIGMGFKFAIDALIAKDMAAFAMTGAATLGAMGASSFAGNGREYLQLGLAQNWRGWLTKQFTDAWLDGKAYLRLQHDKNYVQNPDQRIAETIGNVTGTTLSLALGAFRSAITVVTFGVMLWQLAPIMVGAAAVCAVGAHALTHWTGGSMKKVWRGLMDTEAKFRHALTRVRDNAKTIALTGYEKVETETLKDEYSTLDKQRRDFFKLNFKVNLVHAFNWNSATVVPIALMAPKLLAGTATFGSLELARQFYVNFYYALNWFPQGYSQIASWQANVTQLMEFQQDLKDNKIDILGQTANSQPAPALGPKPVPAPAVAAPGLKPAGVTP